MVSGSQVYRSLYETTDLGDRSTNAAMPMVLRRGILRAREREIERDRLRRHLRWLIESPQSRLLDVAECAAALAALDLLIDTPQVLPMDGVQMRNKPNLAGYTPPGKNNVVVIALDQCAHRIVETAAHECRHRMQMERGKFQALVGNGVHEKDAALFTREFMSKYLTGHFCPCGR